MPPPPPPPSPPPPSASPSPPPPPSQSPAPPGGASSPPPSPSPPAAPPPPVVLTVTLTLAGAVEDVTTEVVDGIRDAFADFAGVDPSKVVVTVVGPGSVLVDVAIEAGDAAAGAALGTRLDAVMGSAEAATAFLAGAGVAGVTVEAAPQVRSSVESAGPPPPACSGENPSFEDAGGFSCDAWEGYDCTTAMADYSYTATQTTQLIANCPLCCAGSSAVVGPPSAPPTPRFACDCTDADASDECKDTCGVLGAAAGLVGVTLILVIALPIAGCCLLVLCIVLCICCCKKRGRDGPKMSSAAAAYRPAAAASAGGADQGVVDAAAARGTLPPKGMSSALQVMGDSKTQVTAVIEGRIVDVSILFYEGGGGHSAGGRRRRGGGEGGRV